MSSGFGEPRRRKDPERVRSGLIETAILLLAEGGLANLALDRVARAAGVTKGGLFHHFPSKQHLLEAVMAAMIADADRAIELVMASDPHPFGRMTRAYVHCALAARERVAGALSIALCRAILDDRALHAEWREWVRQKVAQNALTDDNCACATARLIADGFWLRALSDQADIRPLPPDLRDSVLALTAGSA